MATRIAMRYDRGPKRGFREDRGKEGGFCSLPFLDVCHSYLRPSLFHLLKWPNSHLPPFKGKKERKDNIKKSSPLVPQSRALGPPWKLRRS